MSTKSESLVIEPIEESSLSGENGEIYLFQWLASTEKALQKLGIDDIKSSQAELEATLIKIISTPEPYPQPGRPLRNLVAKCLIALYTRGETRTMFDTLQVFLKIAGDAKTPNKDTNKIAAVFCVGELMGTFGSQVMSLMVEVATTTLKLWKSSNSIILRYHALLALANTLSTAKRALTDSVAKDIIKQMKNALTDKALPIQRVACEVLIIMYPSGDGTRSVADVEAIVNICIKGLELADQLTRRSLARLAAHMLASTQAERAAPPVDNSKKGKKSQAPNEDDEDASTTPHTIHEEAKPIMSANEMFLQLAVHFNKLATSRKSRIGIFDFYAALLTTLGPAFVEKNYALIVSHLFTEIISNPRNSTTRYETLLVRTLVGILLRDLVGVRMLGEQAQITAIQELSNSYLKRWPAMMPGQTAPNPLCLTVALREVAGLLQQLGNAPPPVQDALLDPMINLLSHPNHTVRVTTAWALRYFCYSTPLRLPKVLLNVVEMVQRDIASLTTPAAPSDIRLRSLGHAYGVAALLAIVPERPLYVSYDISAKVFDMAVQLLKRAGEHEVNVAEVEVEIAWTSIASLMTLGPNFVRAHLPQLLVLWRNALPKPTSKDGNTMRSPMEWMFLLHVRESALGAVHSFLRHNSPTLVSPDVARRVSSLLGNALQFVNMFDSRRVEETPDQPMQVETKNLTLTEREALLRTRIFQCFSTMGFSGITESTQSSLLQTAISLFASPDGYTGSTVQAAIASSSGAFTSVWQSVDGYAYGVTDIELSEDHDASTQANEWMNRDSVEVAIHELYNKPVLTSCEHDPLSVCQTLTFDMATRSLEPPPPATAAVNAAMRLFAQLLPLQDLTHLTRAITQLLDSTNSAKLERNVGRKAAVLINTTVALVLALRQANTAHARRVFSTPQVTTPLASFLKDILVDGDLVLRKAGSEAIGRLANLAGTAFLTNQIKTLVDQVVSNRDPHGRAGCALAFGSIHSHVGGLAAGPLLKTSVHVLMSLVNDPHPVVHFWALRALAQVIDAASLAYAPFVSGTLGLLFKVYMLESHEPEGGALGHVNLSGDLPTYQVVCQNIDAVITVTGPDIQDSARTRTLVLDLVHQFIREDDDGICVEAMKCIQDFLLFAPEHVDVPELVIQFRGHLSSTRRPLKLASINALYQLVQKDAFSMSRLGGDQLVEELFAMLDDDPSIEGVRNVITSWLQQTVIHNPSAWIDLCQRIMSRTTASQQVADAAAGRGLQDDEGQSLSVDTSQGGGGGTRPMSRWRTQLFALQCLHSICNIVGRSGRREHLDVAYARSLGLPISGLLVSRVPDLIKIAFTASAAHVTEIRLEGLIVLRAVIEIFAKTPDPDYNDALFLEQHQAPITAALTPAFSSDSTPEILASAVEACAVFVGCGVVKDIQRMGRILKLLTSALEQSKNSGMLSIGDADELSPNASVMLRIATLSAWAELEIASSQQSYLKDVVNPHRATLAALWIASLRDYASIRADTEVLDDTSSGPLDSSYSSLGKEVLLPYYVEAWPVILHAVSNAMQVDDPFILASLDGQESPTTNSTTQGIRDEPCAFFYVVFGLIFEALTTSVPDTDISSRRIPIIALQTLKSLVQPKYCGKVFTEQMIFDELVNLLYRMALTEPASVQIYLVETVASLSFNMSLRRTKGAQANGQMISDDSFDTSQMHCLRICAYVLRRAINGTRDGAIHDHSTLLDKVRLINAAFDAFSKVAAAFGASRKEEFRALAISLYSDLLKDETSEYDLVGPTLQSLKTLLENPPPGDPGNKYGRVVHGLLSACLLNIDEMRGRQGSISARKIKGNMLASVLILTVVPPFVTIGRPVIEHCCFLLAQKLVEDGEIAVIAAHCARTIFVASATGNTTLRQCTKSLLPGMIESVAKMAPTGGADGPDAIAIFGEISKSFSALLISVPEEFRARTLGVLLPTLILLLDPSSSTPLHGQSVSELVSLAAASPAAFKEATAALSAPMRELMENSLRQAFGNTTQAVETPKPQISLRSF